MTRASTAMRPGGPSASRLPRTSTAMRSACLKTTSRLCSVNSTAMRCVSASSRVRRMSAWRSLVAMPAVGSSISNSRGRCANAIASSTRLTWPYARAPQWAPARSAMPTCSSSARASSARCDAARRQGRSSRRSRDSSAVCTFSSTVIERNVAAVWKVRPTPRRQILPADRPISSRPSSRTEPASGRNCPPTTLKQVDLPAPFGPINASMRPASSSNETSASASMPPKDLRSPWTRSKAGAVVMRVCVPGAPPRPPGRQGTA